MARTGAVLLVGGMTSALLVGTAGPALAAPKTSISYITSYFAPGEFMVTKASCLRYARRDYANCRKLPPIPYVRQACWAAAAGKLAACIARSNG